MSRSTLSPLSTVSLPLAMLLLLLHLLLAEAEVVTNTSTAVEPIAGSPDNSTLQVTFKEGDVYTLPTGYARCSIADHVVEIQFDRPTSKQEAEVDPEIHVNASGLEGTQIFIYNSTSNAFPVTLKATRFGYAHVTCFTEDNTQREIHFKILRDKSQAFTLAFRLLVLVAVILINIGMGCEIDLKVVMENFKKPLAPIVGLFCQFIIMPLLFYFYIYIFGLTGGVAFALFVVGCAPGGGASNMYSLIFGGNISLSITMTFISNIVCLGTMPLWMFMLSGSVLNGHKSDSSQLDVVIPYVSMVTSLLFILVPQLVGVAIQLNRKSLAERIRAWLKPMIYTIIVAFFALGIYQNFFVFAMLTWRSVAAGCLAPYSGFLLGALIACVCGLNYANVLTISLETGLQNVAIALLVCMQTLPEPESEFALVGIYSSGIFVPLPFYMAMIYINVKKRCFKKKEPTFTKVATTSSEFTEEIKVEP